MEEFQSYCQYPNGKFICGCESFESIGAWLAKLLLLLYQKRSEWPMALCKQTTLEMVQIEQADESAQKTHMVAYIVYVAA